MRQDMVPSLQKAQKTSLSDTQKSLGIFSDIKSLFKGPVLLANVLPVFTAFWLALYFNDASFGAHWSLFLLTIIGSTLVVGGALVLNNWYDVDIDTIMDRTKNRPTVTGNFSLKAVLTLGITLTILGFILLLFTTIEATIYAFIGWFTYVVLYTMWSKRRYAFNTIIGSVSGAVTPLIGWAVIAPVNHIVPIVLFLILFIFQMPHTFAIAMRKYEEYKAAKVAMLPVVRGFKVTKRQMVLYIACLLPLPFFLTSLGTAFIVIATLLNIGWLVVGISGFYVKDDIKWAYVNFLYSVNYITILFVSMVLVTLKV
ncbi:protoheme IX farnesyltransferase [Mesobacillus persicus]|uniref:Protoheme IX farnesyltransferase n=1 Tax=Mesobacillus persicus TaxID=930146 RepID=A0A1H8AME2_9BACI|nr:heme o synthase [Mesobacillus persicus]SEM70919.1 protoheme IX farnesyltransferase [Mesobacillus persicus]